MLKDSLGTHTLTHSRTHIIIIFFFFIKTKKNIRISFSFFSKRKVQWGRERDKLKKEGITLEMDSF